MFIEGSRTLGFDFTDEIPPAAQQQIMKAAAASQEAWKHDQHSGERRKFVGIRKLIASIRNRPSARELAIIIYAVQ